MRLSILLAALTGALAFSSITHCPQCQECPPPSSPSSPSPPSPCPAVEPCEPIVVEATVFSEHFNGCGGEYPPQTYSEFIDVFDGVTTKTLATSGECIKKVDWQTAATKQKEEGLVCLTGPFDGQFAFGHEKDGRMVMRVIVNSEIRAVGTRGFKGSTSSVFYVSTNPDKGGWGQPEPADNEKIPLYGSTLMYLDMNRETLEVEDVGHAIKKMYTVKKEYHNKQFSATATSDEIYSILDDYSALNNNIRADQDTPRPVTHADCELEPGYCGLYAHCGSSYSTKHGHSYASPATNNVKIDGVGFEDRVAFISHEGSLATGNIRGTIQVLDVDTGDQYQLPHLSVGTTENAFAISTGETEYVAVIIMEYGLGGAPTGAVDPISFPTGRASSYGSRINMWVGKKDKSSTHFLDRNGLGPNQGRYYVFVSNENITDTATLLNWPATAKNCSLFTRRSGRFEPLPTMFDGRFKNGTSPIWTDNIVNSLKTLQGNEPVRMTGVASQEWGSRSPTNPASFGIAHTTLSATLNPRPADIDDQRGTVSLWTASVAQGVNTATGDVKSRNGAVLPNSIPASVNHVMQDEMIFPGREARGVPRGVFKPDGLVWLKDGTLIVQEDQSRDQFHGYAVHYDPTTCSGKAIAAALEPEHGRMSFLGTPPLGAHMGGDENELTGAYDFSAALSVPAGYTAEDEFNAFDSRTIGVNTQIWNAGQGKDNCLTDYQLAWGGQMNLLSLPA